MEIFVTQKRSTYTYNRERTLLSTNLLYTIKDECPSFVSYVCWFYRCQEESLKKKINSFYPHTCDVLLKHKMDSLSSSEIRNDVYSIFPYFIN